MKQRERTRTSFIFLYFINAIIFVIDNICRVSSVWCWWQVILKCFNSKLKLGGGFSDNVRFSLLWFRFEDASVKERRNEWKLWFFNFLKGSISLLNFKQNHGSSLPLKFWKSVKFKLLHCGWNQTKIYIL